MEYIGIDVHKKESQVCVLGEDGKVVLEQRLATQRERLAEVLGKWPKARVLLESSTESEWVARCLEKLWHEVVVADPNFAPMYATRSRRVKTDKRNARTLAEACKLGAYRRAHRMSDERRHLRAQVAAREVLVRTRTRLISQVSAQVRQEGLRVRTGDSEHFALRVAALTLPGRLQEQVAPLLAVLKLETISRKRGVAIAASAIVLPLRAAARLNHNHFERFARRDGRGPRDREPAFQEDRLHL
jgi:transposase